MQRPGHTGRKALATKKKTCVLRPAFSFSVLRHSGASGSMSFVWSLYDRIIDLSDAFANHFNNLLALDFQEETVQVGQDANQEQ